MSDTLEKLRKIKELAEKGVGGERTNAQAILKRLLTKYGLEYDEIFSPEPERHWVEFWFRDNWHREILYGCYAAVTGLRRFPIQKYGNHRTLLQVTAWEELELRNMFDYHKKLWTKQLHDVLLAFVVKHHLYSSAPCEDEETDNSEPIDPDKIRRVTTIMDGMQDGQYKSTRRMLPDGDQ